MEGKLTAEEAERLQILAKRDTGSLAINVLMSFGAIAVAAGIIALKPSFTTGAALGVALVAIGLGISFFTARSLADLGSFRGVDASPARTADRDRTSPTGPVACRELRPVRRARTGTIRIVETVQSS